MQDAKSRVLIVSGRSLVAEGLKSLLVGESEISEVEIVGSLYDALVYSLSNPPDAMVIDLPAGADLFVDRPISVDGHEIKTIVLLEGDRNIEARLYVHIPGKTANLSNLMAAILWDGKERRSVMRNA
jgi:DNA-binding NarL/FixJ family response regulator